MFQFESGGKTQIVGWISATIMLLVLLFIGPAFQYLPKVEILYYLACFYQGI